MGTPTVQRRPQEEATAQATPDVALEQLLAERWSCRAFLPDPVPSELIQRLLTLAQRSPSWSNTQPWQVLVTEGEGTVRFKQAITEYAQQPDLKMDSDFPRPTSYEGIYNERRRECGWQLYNSVGIARGDRIASAKQALRNFDLFGAPHAAIVTTPAEQGVYAAVDAGLYVATFLYAAQALGLAAVAQAALARYGAFMHAHFDIPDDRMVVVGISFGYPDLDDPVNAFRTSRAELGDAVEWVR